MHAFLAFNREFKVILALQALVRSYPEEIARLVPRVAGANPGAFWISRLPSPS